MEELLERCEDIANMATAFALVQRYETKGLRRPSHRSYSIFYRINEDVVEVIHVLHGARNFEVLLNEEVDRPTVEIIMTP